MQHTSVRVRNQGAVQGVKGRKKHGNVSDSSIYSIRQYLYTYYKIPKLNYPNLSALYVAYVCAFLRYRGNRPRLISKLIFLLVAEATWPSRIASLHYA